MRAVFVLPVDYRVHNYMRAMALDIDRKYETGLAAASPPPHVTLKQPLRVPNLRDIETYFDGLAYSTEPLEITLTHVELQSVSVGDGEKGVLWLAVRETPMLRGLHQRINRELAERFENTQAPFDGPDFKFHATVAVGGQPVEVYRRIYAEYESLRVDLSFTATQIAMACSHGDREQASNFITFKILPLGDKG